MADTLLLVDVLTDFSHRDGARLEASFRDHAAELEAVIDAARRQQVPVVYANDHFGDWCADRREILRRAQASGVFADVQWILPRPDEPLILKPRYSAFDQTPLDLLLSELETSRILLAGAALEMCVAQTAIAAREHGYKVSVMVDACPEIDKGKRSGRPRLSGACRRCSPGRRSLRGIGTCRRNPRDRSPIKSDLQTAPKGGAARSGDWSGRLLKHAANSQSARFSQDAMQMRARTATPSPAQPRGFAVS